MKYKLFILLSFFSLFFICCGATIEQINTYKDIEPPVYHIYNEGIIGFQHYEWASGIEKLSATSETALIYNSLKKAAKKCQEEGHPYFVILHESKRSYIAGNNQYFIYKADIKGIDTVDRITYQRKKIEYVKDYLK